MSTAGASPKWTIAGVRRPSPEWRWSSLYHGKKTWPKARASAIDPKRSGNSGRYFSVRN
jgi:hypothetical protein